MGKHVHLWRCMPHSELQISCQKCRPKHFNFTYIYRVSYENAKKSTAK